MTLAPRLCRSAIVGTLALTRPSSVIVAPSRGTFRSERTRTRLPRSPPSSSARCSTVFSTARASFPWYADRGLLAVTSCTLVARGHRVQDVREESSEGLADVGDEIGEAVGV